MTFVPVIGLETHVQVKTVSKIFCGCPTEFGASPNSEICPICLGLPGVLPVLNRQVLSLGIRVALGLHCRVCERIVFHRKNYFYPDLPKGFQISQYDLPLGNDGFVQVHERKVRIHRVHMEEDAGKLIHKAGEEASLVDFNRCGMPLLEIVTEPDLGSPDEAYEYLKILKTILQYLEVSDCDMEKGSLRCDANISLSPASAQGGKGEGKLGTKVEIKNLNSFKAVARSLSYEIERQTQVLEAGGKLHQETRLWDDLQSQTRPMRSKEFAHDYRYFPEPDLVPFSVSQQEVRRIQASLPELPHQRAARFVSTYRLPEADARGLTASKATADYFEEVVRLAKKGTEPASVKKASTEKVLANWVLGDLSREVNALNLEDVSGLKFPPAHLVDLVTLISSGQISGKMAKEVFMEALRSQAIPSAIVRSKGLAQMTDRSALEEAARGVIAEQHKAVTDYRQGKAQALMFLVGQLMKKTKGAASPDVSQDLLRHLLNQEKNG